MNLSVVVKTQGYFYFTFKKVETSKAPTVMMTITKNMMELCTTPSMADFASISWTGSDVNHDR